MICLPLQTDLTCHRIQEFETQTSTDLEARNNKIEDQNRTIEEQKQQIVTLQKVCIAFI